MRSIILRDMYWPMAKKIRRGSTQESRMPIKGDISSTISPENSAPESYRRWVSCGSSRRPVLNFSSESFSV